MQSTIIDYLEKRAKDINREIEKALPRDPGDIWCEWTLGKPKYSYDISTITEAIITPIYDLLDRGGKRWRPALMLLCVEAVGGDPNDFLEFTALPEIIHNGTLMIDDVEDNSEKRRGKPCIHKTYGIDIAVNAGNSMYYLPLSYLFKNPQNLSPATRLALYDLISEEMIRLHVGQGMDIYWHQGNVIDIKENDYLQMCAYKTGTLARLAAKMGVILAGGTSKQEDALGQFAETVGIAFQIQDDILNLIGTKFGAQKGVGEDIHEGKRTLIILRALRVLDDKKGKRLLAILDSHPTTQATIDEAIKIIRATDAIEYAAEVAKKLIIQAWTDVDQSLPNSDSKTNLKKIADYLIEREM